MLAAEAPGKDSRGRWYGFSVFVSVAWGGLSHSVEAAEPAGSPPSPDSPGMQVSVATAAACLQLAAHPRAGWKGQFWVLVVEHTSLPWRTQQSGSRLSEMAAASQYALKVISLSYRGSRRRPSRDLHYFLYKHVGCKHPMPKSLWCKWERQARDAGGERTQRWKQSRSAEKLHGEHGSPGFWMSDASAGTGCLFGSAAGNTGAGWWNSP